MNGANFNTCAKRFRNRSPGPKITDGRKIVARSGAPPSVRLALTAADLIAWTQTTLLDGDLAVMETKLLRYRLLHVAARILTHGRQTIVKIADGWPWADQLVAAFTRLAAIRQPRYG